jgi:hypothetical protein
MDTSRGKIRKVSRKAWLFGSIVSALAHGALVALLPAGPSASLPAAAPGDGPVTVELVGGAPSPATGAIAQPDAAPPVRRHSALPAPSPAPVAEPAPRKRAVDLTLHAEQMAIIDGEVDTGQVDQPTSQPPPPPTQRNLDAWWRQARATDNVRSGRVAPDLYEIARAAERRFRPDWDVTSDDPRGLGSVTSTTRAWLSSFLGAYQDRLRQDDDLRRLRRTRPGALNGTEDMLGGYDRLMHSAALAANEVATDLCFSVGGSSATTPPPRIARSSGNRAIDAVATDALERALRLGLLPEQTAPAVACLRFTARFQRIPPLPVLGCAFDLWPPDVSCYYPLKRMLKTRVALLSVDYSKQLAATR